MAYSNNWTIANNPADHSQFQAQPGYVRKVRQDVQDRLAAILYGFTSGETDQGVKYLPFKDQAGDAPQAASGFLNLYAKTVSTVLGFYFITAGSVVYQVITGLGGSLAGALNEAQGADIASATTTDIGAATGNYVNVTGTTTITGLGTIQAGTKRVVTFKGALTLTHNATSLILPTGANIVTVAEDVAEFISLGSGNWKCTSFLRASGSSLAVPAATQAEQEAASSTSVAVTPGRQQYHPSAAKAWCVFAGATAGTNAPTAGFNVTSVTKNGTGDYTINFTAAFSSANYAVAGFGIDSSGGGAQVLVSGTAAPAAGSLRIKTFNAGGSLIDATTISLVFFGDQ